MRVPQQAWAAVAAHLSGRWDKRRGDRATLLVKGRPIAAKVVVIGRRNIAKPRLRFDRVALRLMNSLDAAISPRMSSGSCVMISCTAPIRLPAKVAHEIELAATHSLLHLSGRDFTARLSGNAVRIRPLRGLRGMPKVCTFVHNPETDSAGLLDVAQTLLVGAGRHSRRGVAPSLLVLFSRGDSGDFDAYRTVHQTLLASLPRQRILMVFADGKVKPLG